MTRTAEILAYTLRHGDAVSDHTLNLARILAATGWEVRILINDAGDAPPADLPAAVALGRTAPARAEADLTILQYPIWYPLAERFRSTAGARLFWYHGVTPAAYASDSQRYRLETAAARTDLAWHAHLAVADSPFGASELAHHAGLDPAAVEAVPLGLDIARFAEPADPATLAALRTRHGLAGQQVMVYVGRLTPSKGLDLLVAALAQLRPAYPRLHLIIVGDPAANTQAAATAAQLRGQAASLGVAGAVTFAGRVPAVPPYLHLADLCVLPSRHEGFGVPVVEAMAAGTPVVVTAVGALPWLAEGDSGPAALVVPPERADLLAAAIARLIDDPDLAAALAARGRIRAQAFSLDRFQSRTLAAVDRCLAAAAQPAPSVVDAPLLAQADIARRDDPVQSQRRGVGPLVTWLRRHATSHFKEAYLDLLVERQVAFNRRAARRLYEIERDLAEVRAALARPDHPPHA